MRAMRRPIVLATLVVLSSCPGRVLAAEAPAIDLQQLLDRLGRVAWLYADTALRFSCRETITADNQSPHHYDYIYTPDENGRFKDYRTRTVGHGGQEVDLKDEHLPRWLGQAYSWVFIFRADKRQRYHFVATDGDEVLGRPAIRLTFEPIPPYEEGLNDWSGTAFIDRETSQILRVEASSLNDFLERSRFDAAVEGLRAALPGGARSTGLEPQPRQFKFETIVTEFGAEKNGMRFPSEVLIEMRRYRVPGRHGRESDSERVYRVRQEYADYRFFSVRTEQEIKALFSAPAPAP
jgi:hypothetical protein